MEILENPSEREYSKVNYIFSKNNDRFTNGLNFPMWNISNFNFIYEVQNNVNMYLRDFNTLQKSSIEINGHQFNKVVTISSESDESFLFGPLIQNVNEIKYDYDFGIIQFKDVLGNEWNLVYPK
jgi:hypothetical protein